MSYEHLYKKCKWCGWKANSMRYGNFCNATCKRKWIAKKEREIKKATERIWVS